MKEFNYLEIDGKLLNLFLAVFEEQSVTKASERLNLTQSAVSHGLEKLRQITKDPLFVRSGRGITPTFIAGRMVEDVRSILRDIKSLSQPRGFELKTASGQFVLAASDVLWPLLVCQFFQYISEKAPKLDLRIVNAGTNLDSLLRNGVVDLVLTPYIPDGSEFRQQKLFEDEFVCFFDPEITDAPKTVKEYIARKHACIVFSSVEMNPIDRMLASMGEARRVPLQVPSFAGLPSLIKGTELIALLPSVVGKSIMLGFETGQSPMPIDNLKIYQVWHGRDNDNPLHGWVRGFLKNLTSKF